MRPSRIVEVAARCNLETLLRRSLPKLRPRVRYHSYGAMSLLLATSSANVGRTVV